ncbi:MAG: hypothetical protein N2749_06940, partial [Clostridia bacterium]|nr:hypothetical protein [Clostridia bacterium]
MKFRKGISLIVLVITMLVLIVVAMAIITTINQKNPIDNAKEAVFKKDLKNIEMDLSLYHTNQYAETLGRYQEQSLQADKDSVEYNGQVYTDKTIKDIIPSLKNTTKYDDLLEIVNGNLVYTGINKNEKEWSEEVMIEAIHAEPKVEVTGSSELIVRSGIDVEYEVKFTSKYKLIDSGINSKIELLNSQDQKITDALTITITKNSEETEITTKVVVDTTSLTDGMYKIKINKNSVRDENNVYQEKELISSEFEVNNVAPVAPEITPDTTTWTNSDVIVTITYSVESAQKKYSIDNRATWQNYTGPITISENKTIYAKGINYLGTESTQSTLDITVIDKIAPTVTAVNGGVTTSSVTVNATASDDGGSALKASAYEYSKDNGTTWAAATSAATYSFTGLTSGTYQCRVRVTDNAGNVAISNVVALNTQGIGDITLNPSITAWTNTNVTVTITYPAELTTKEYSTDAGSTWNNYTAAITMTANGTVLARGNDVAGNQAAQSSLTISNIDKTAPTVTAVNGGVTTSSVTVNAT